MPTPRSASSRPPRRRVDLNVDLGELEVEPVALYALATVVNLACGGHAGDASSMARAVDLALEAGVAIAAHPSYADRDGFGRRSGHSTGDAVRRDVEAQCAALDAIVEARGGRIVAVKPHGALYHDAADDLRLASMVVEAAHAALGPSFAVVGPAWGVLGEAASFDRLAYHREGFADRGYDAQGRLLPRGAPGALLTDPAAAAAQAIRLAESGQVETICVHGDTPCAVAVARAVRAALEEAEWLRPRA